MLGVRNRKVWSAMRTRAFATAGERDGDTM